MQFLGYVTCEVWVPIAPSTCLSEQTKFRACEHFSNEPLQQETPIILRPDRCSLPAQKVDELVQSLKDSRFQKPEFNTHIVHEQKSASQTNTTKSKLKKGIPILYKTEFCKNYETGICKYGPKCQFAHGPKDFQPRVRDRRYKTIKCNKPPGNCLYGNRCNFIHDDDNNDK